jgi:acylphosphatase
MRKEFRAIVRGRVQLVMYRDFAARTAGHLNIAGTVRNLPDGTVEIVAQGEQIVLTAYLEKLNHGPLLSKVEHIDVAWRELKEVMDGFSILY